MARLPRLSLAGHAHLVLLRGHNGESIFRDDADRQSFLEALAVACARERVALHGFALLVDRVWLLCTPTADRSLGRAVQSLGRRFASAFNRRHGRTGGLWDGRYRCTVVEPGATLLEAMVFVDQLGADPSPEGGDSGPGPWSSARQHLGREGPIPLTDLGEYWALGNTPFDRAIAYRQLLSERRTEAECQQVAAAAEKGWALGSKDFIAGLQHQTQRPLMPRPRGRPRKG